MNLAEEWVDSETCLHPPPHFHDEVKDGCGGVEWQKYVLKKAHTSNELLFGLARAIRGLQRRRGHVLTPLQSKLIFDKWEAVSRPYLRPHNDYFTEFLAKLDYVTVPKGETLGAAFMRAKTKPPPAKVLIHQNTEVRLLASLCRELQEMAGDQPFMLCQISVAHLFGHSSHRTISNWIKVLKILDILKVAEPWSWNKAARYFYVA